MENNEIKNDGTGLESGTTEKAPGQVPESAKAPASKSQQDAKKPTSPFAVASLVLGIVAVVVAFMPFSLSVSLILGIVGLVLAIIGIVGIRKGKNSGNGMAIAGLVLSLIAIIIYVIAYFTFVNAVNQTATAFNNAASQYSKMLKK